MNRPIGAIWRAQVLRGWGGGRRLYLCDDHTLAGGWVRVVKDFVFEDHHEGDAWLLTDGIPRADEFIQAVMDVGWEDGMRPKQWAEVKNETSALREHLADMKRIAFHQLKIRDAGPR